MNRQSFNKLVGLGTANSLGVWPIFPQQERPPDTGEKLPVKYPEGAYRRLLVDTHVPDWDPRLLAAFDSADYVRTIAQAGF